VAVKMINEAKLVLYENQIIPAIIQFPYFRAYLGRKLKLFIVRLLKVGTGYEFHTYIP
jgi:hypothetical protein